MGTQTRAQDAGATQALKLSRTFNGPREQVFKTWTDPTLIKQWWGPKGYSCPEYKLDLRVGGKYLGCMRSDKGEDVWSTGEFKEIVRPERLVMTDSFADKTGKVISAESLKMPGKWPLECLVTVILTEEGNKTKAQITHQGIPPEMFDDCTQGWQSSFDKFDDVLKASL